MAAQQVRKERIFTVRVDSGRTLTLGKFDGPKVPDFGQWSHPVTVAKVDLAAAVLMMSLALSVSARTCFVSHLFCLAARPLVSASSFLPRSPSCSEAWFRPN